MNICGIDPGYSASGPGGLALLGRPDDGPPLLIEATAMPLMALPSYTKLTRHLRQCDLYAVTALLRAWRPGLVVIEMQGTRIGQHAGRGFKAAVHYGSLIGIACALDLPYELVAPHIWKPAMGLGHQSKEASRRLATTLMPPGERLWSRHKDHGIAEAALLAWWRIEHGPASLRPRGLPSPRPGGKGAAAGPVVRGHRHQPGP